MGFTVFARVSEISLDSIPQKKRSRSPCLGSPQNDISQKPWDEMDPRERSDSWLPKIHVGAATGLSCLSASASLKHGHSGIFKSVQGPSWLPKIIRGLNDDSASKDEWTKETLGLRRPRPEGLLWVNFPMMSKPNANSDCSFWKTRTS